MAATRSQKRKQTARADSRLPDPTAVSKGELSKSSVTRTRIMEAGVTCLAEDGYASTTTSTVAERAGLTRAAMLYHFPSRMALIEAVIHYVTRRRIDMYKVVMAEIPQDENFFLTAIDEAWAQLDTKEFQAFSELSMAARTDEELSASFAPALAEYDRARRETAIALFPEAALDAPWFDLRRDITRFLSEGLMQQGGLSFNAERRKANLVGFLKALSSDKAGAELLKKALEIARKES
ncbi:MAG: TetR/AcrR family transcriptional regulator [Alphaproteobacteria bacterium]